MTKTVQGVSLALCVLIAAPLVGCAGSATQESTGEYIDDSAITTKVKTKLFQDPKTSAFQVKVDTFKGVVQLSGFVSSEAAKTRAGELAREVPGVRSVKNNLVVK
jgi:osmotically-inducible protein OsmY